MHFQPRIRSAGETNPGVVCCSAELALCDTCKAHFAWGGAPRAASLRTAADYTPPDPYKRQLAQLRADLSSTRRWPEPRVASTPAAHDYTPPDPYAGQLSKLKKEQR